MAFKIRRVSSKSVDRVKSSDRVVGCIFSRIHKNTHKMASESIVPRVVPDVGCLEWPRFCYAGKIYFSHISRLFLSANHL